MRASCSVSGPSDAEMRGGSLYANDNWRLLTGAARIASSGRNSSANKPDSGAGNFERLRTAAQVAHLPTPTLVLTVNVSLGLNGSYKDNDLRNGK